MTLLMGWLARSRLKRRIRKGSEELYYPAGIFIMGMIDFLFFAALVVLSNVYSNDATTWTTLWTTAVFAGFAATSFLMVLDYFRAHHRLAGDGLHFGKLFGSRGYVTWGDIRQVSYSNMAKWFVIKTRSGQTVRISTMLVGLPEFARAIIANAPSSIEPAAHPILHAAAKGNLPSIWA